MDAERRVLEHRLRLSAEIRAMRGRRGWTQAQLAERAGVGRMVVARLERLEGHTDIDLLERIALAFGRPLSISFGRDHLEEPTDAGHLAIQELVLRLAARSGFVGRFELATPSAEPWRSTDVGLIDDAGRRLVLVECWNRFGDVGAGARSSERKRAEAEGLAVARWGSASHDLGLVWVVRHTARNRLLLARYPEVFASRFPGSSRAWIECLTRSGAVPTHPGLVWSDRDATRLFAWRQRSTR